jgi:hypothetical protein
MIEKYSKIIIQIILNKQEAKSIEWNKIDFYKLLVQASHNRVLYLFAKKLIDSDVGLQDEDKNLLVDILREGKKKIEILGDTLLLLEGIFAKENIDYLIVKTFKYLDYVTFDVDVLVRYKEFKKAINILGMNNIAVKPHPTIQGLHQKNCFKPGYLNMDLHRKFFWLGVDHIDLDFVWSTKTERVIGEVNCPAPRLEVDFLLHNKQLVHERRYITLLDFLAVKYANDEGLNWDKIMEQVVKYKWDNTFFILLNWLNYIHREIFKKNMVDVNKYCDVRPNAINKKELKMPLHYPVKDVIKVFKEIAFKQKHIPFFGFAYYFFTTVRYKIKNRLPFYDHWYDFNKVK